MKVILKQDVAGQGKKGDVRDVNDGYARNYLIKNGLAAEATAGGLDEIKRQHDAAAAGKAAEKNAAEALAAQINALAVTVAVKAGENGKIFGSVTGKEIAEQLNTLGVPVDKKQLVLRDTIKQTGAYQIEVKIAPGISAKCTLTVTAE
jgi:large subunit ribosomal protein L9